SARASRQFPSGVPVRGEGLKCYLIPCLAFAFAAFSLSALRGDTINFDHQQPGALPPFWTSTATHAPAPHRWEVIRDPMSPSRPNVFASTGGADSESSLAVFDKAICRDGELSVKFRIAPGAHRIKTAGLVWRYQDPRNYYLLH